MINYKEIINNSLFFIAVVLCIVLMGIAGWKLERWLNWKLAYDDISKEEINRAISDHVNKYHSGEIK
jgi:hypothetical protein